MPAKPKTPPPPLEPLVTLGELCALFSVKPATVKKNRSRGTNELFMKGFVPFGPAGGLRWHRSDVRDYMAKIADDVA
ncbi:DNA-binding protein [Rhodococcoides fascians]|uniref:DNA-binding protein n=1 Tax=Rhodococcoides fascians TaxID=1828 RepID=UPI00050CE36A|nr:DNA-binding protein [Rhodococcus fascians]